MSHAHGHRPSQAAWPPLLTVFTLNLLYCVVEVVAGWWTNSLALIADAGHMLTDVFAIGLSLFAVWLSGRPATTRNTYGYHRGEILVALVNGVVLWGLVVWIGVEAYRRFSVPPTVIGGPMLVVAVIGLGVNLASAWVLSRVAPGSLNVHGAYLHVVFDALGSLGAIGAGGLILWKGWMVADPLLSLGTAGLIVWSAWKLIQEAVRILMEGAPSHVDTEGVRRALLNLRGVKDVHDLHVWTLTSGLEAMSGHAVIEDVTQSQEILEAAHHLLCDRFHIDHMTLQLETQDLGTCDLSAYHQ